MLRIGLTGNIGSGKTLVANIFRKLSIPVFDADQEARTILNSTATKTQLRIIFGNEIFEFEEINRKALAAIVFNDPVKLKLLNGLIHPSVRNLWECWSRKDHKAPYLIYEAAILIETGFYKHLDKIIMVSANEEHRIQRVMQRDAVNRETVLQRMGNQWDEKRKISYADYVIFNNDGDLLIQQVIKIHQQLEELNFSL